MLMISFLQNNKNLMNSPLDQRQRNDRRLLNPISRRHSASSSRPATNLITLTTPPAKNGRERSLSLSTEDDRRRSASSSRYKTELCRPFEENGTCKYGDKCQFAHGYHELRQLSRHPKYKTELCRTFHTIGFCPYGPRCHFIHNAEEKRPSHGSSSNRLSMSSPPPLSPLLNGPPSPPFEPTSPLPTSLTPPSPSPLSFYNDDSPLESPLQSPLPLPMSTSPRVNNVFTFPSHPQIPAEFSSTPCSTSAVSSPRAFVPTVSPIKQEDDELENEDSLPPSPPDSLDGFSDARRRLPVFNRLSVNE